MDQPAASAPSAVPAALSRPVVYQPGPNEHPHIDRDETLRYLGYTGQEMTLDLAVRIEGVVAELERTIAP